MKMKNAATKFFMGIVLWIICTTGVPGAVRTVQMVGTSFVPAQLTINAGDTVRWVNVSGSHDVQSDTPLFKSPPPPVSTFEFTFSQAGRFTYRCNPHAAIGMRGTITVEAAANQPPTVTIVGPANGATFTSTSSVTIEAQASDPDGSVVKVDFFSNGNLVGTATSSPFDTTLPALSPGQYALTATATDNGGATATSAAVNITVTAVVNSPPAVSITSPSEGAAFTAPAAITVTADASDPDGSISKVEFFANGNLVGTATSAPFAATLNDVAAGNYALTAKATDNEGASTTSGVVNVIVNPATANNPPTVSITSPATGLTLAAPAAVTLEASASDSDGSVTEVTFFRAINQGGPAPGCCTLEPIGTVATSPYKLPLDALPPGFYHMVAQATDNQGAKTVSSEVVVTVYTPFKVETITHANGETVLHVKDAILPGPFTLSAQASIDLQNWTDLSGSFAAVGGGILELKDATSLTLRFYRVQAKFQEVQPAN